jgi:hypothetical protein
MRSCATRLSKLNGPAQQLRRGRFQIELHRQRIDDVDAVDRAHFAAAHAAFGVEIAHQLVFYRLRVELLTVLELHTVAHMNDEVRRVLQLVSGRQDRDDVQLSIDVEQFVAQTGKHDASDIG